MNEMSRCKYCEHFNSKHLKCKYQGKECLTLGNEDVTFNMYKEVNQDEKDRRDSFYRLQDKRREQLNAQNKVNEVHYALHVALLFGMVIIGIALCILMLVYRFSHPELTETQLIIYFFQKYWWMFGIIVVGLVASNFLNKQ